MQRLKVSLASSAELKTDRERFEIFVNRKNRDWLSLGIFIELVIWEDFIDAMGIHGLQAEYNKAILDCDIFVMLYCTKVGPYTSQEFETAFEAFQQNGRPMIYTYYREEVVVPHDPRPEDQSSLEAFQAKMLAMGHFPVMYKNTEDLLLRFGGQLEKLKGSGRIGMVENVNSGGNNEQNPNTKYNIGNIILLLTHAFDAIEFEGFAFAQFPEVQRQFTPGMAQPSRILSLLTHACNHGRIERLLTAVKTHNEYQYNNHAPYQIL